MRMFSPEPSYAEQGAARNGQSRVLWFLLAVAVIIAGFSLIQSNATNPGGGSGITRFLRIDGNWAVPSAGATLPALDSAASAGATSIAVTIVPSNTTTTAYVVIDPGNTNCEIRSIVSISGGTVNIGTTIGGSYPLHYAHSAGAAVYFISGIEGIPWTWFGAVPNVNSVAAAVANREGFNRLSTNLYAVGSLRGPARIIIPSGVHYSDHELKLERDLVLEGMGPDLSQIKAHVNFPTNDASGETAMIHCYRDGLPAEYIDPGPSGRWHMRNFLVDGSSRQNVNGILTSPQQPDFFDNIRVENFNGVGSLYGIAICDCQDFRIENIEGIACNVPLRFRSASFIEVVSFNAEQSTVSHFIAETNSTGAGCDNNIFIGTHMEALINGGTNWIDIRSGENWTWITTWLSNYDTNGVGFYISVISGGGYPYFTLKGFHCNQPSTNFYAIRDVQRNLSRTVTEVDRDIQVIYSGKTTATGWAMEISGSPGGSEDYPPRFANGILSMKGNKAAPTTMTFPASTVNWTNTTRFNIQFYIDNTAGSVTSTAIKKNGTTIFTGGNATFGLQPGEYFSETYSAGTPIGTYTPF